MGDILWCSFMGFRWILMEKKKSMWSIYKWRKKEKVLVIFHVWNLFHFEITWTFMWLFQSPIRKTLIQLGHSTSTWNAFEHNLYMEFNYFLFEHNYWQSIICDFKSELKFWKIYNENHYFNDFKFRNYHIVF